MKNLITIGKYVLLLLLTSLCCVSCDIEEDENEPFYVSVKITNSKSEPVHFYVGQNRKMGVGSGVEYTTTLMLTETTTLSVRTDGGMILNSKTVSGNDVYFVDLKDGSTEGNADSDLWMLPIKVQNTGASTEYVYIEGVKKYKVDPFETLIESVLVKEALVTVEIKSETGVRFCSKACFAGESFEKRRVDFSIMNFYSGKTLLLYCDGKKLSAIQDGTSENSYTYVDYDCLIEVKDEDGNLLDSKKIKESESTYDYIYTDPNKTYIVVENNTNDNYDITVDGVMIGIVAPGSMTVSVNNPGKHQLNAKQKDGYVLWATEENKNVDCVAGIYSWDFGQNVFKLIK